jgi:hypothetical protein
MLLPHSHLLSDQQGLVASAHVPLMRQPNERCPLGQVMLADGCCCVRLMRELGLEFEQIPIALSSERDAPWAVTACESHSVTLFNHAFALDGALRPTRVCSRPIHSTIR